jgi:hypothetical protein
MNDTSWRYPEGAPQLRKQAVFGAWVAGCGSPTKSTAAYGIIAKAKP